MKPSSLLRPLSASLAGLLFCSAMLMVFSAVSAATITVVGTPHLSALDPAPTQSQHRAVVERLATFEPSVVCIEAMPGERVEQYLADPRRHGELLRSFGYTATQLAPIQQVRLGLDRHGARAEAVKLEQQEAPLDIPQRVRLIGLQLAAYEPWSALLNWSYLQESERVSAEDTLGSLAATRLAELTQSSNEVVALGIPLARLSGHRRMCAVDSFVDESTVQTLAEELMPIIGDADIQAGIAAFAKEQSAHWGRDGEDGLVGLLAWMNSPEWAQRDRATQWEVFDSGVHDAATRRLMLWHARNAEILTWLFRTLGEADGSKPLLLIGGAHRPFIHEALESHSWLHVVPARSLLAP